MTERYEILKGEKRNDAVELRPAKETAQGFLDVEMFITRTGIFDYELPDGSIRRELRHPDDVFHPDSLASLQHAVMTNKHPPELVNRDNAPAYVVGFLTTTPQVVLQRALKTRRSRPASGRKNQGRWSHYTCDRDQRHS